VNILLEGVPEEIELAEVRTTLAAIPGVLSFHDLHVWALSSGKVSLTVHLVNDDKVDAERSILPAVRKELAEKFGITHITVQCELAPCGFTSEEHHFRNRDDHVGQAERASDDADQRAHDHSGHKH
jgi:cobalt-zinc-cadmium efflux system protein